MTVGDGREPERAADLLGGVDQAGGQARLVTVKCSTLDVDVMALPMFSLCLLWM
jgi:hypothetical protein